MYIINRFHEQFRFLSNFYPACIMFEGIEYPTVEHAYQAAKTNDRGLKLTVAAARSPGAAKRMGPKLSLRPNWEQVKVDIMRALLWLKFTRHSDLRDQLLATGGAELVEGNHWNDTFWGVCRGAGCNQLGKILMEIRRELAEQRALLTAKFDETLEPDGTATGCNPVHVGSTPTGVSDHPTVRFGLDPAKMTPSEPFPSLDGLD